MTLAGFVSILAGPSTATCGVAWGLVCVRAGTREVDHAWYTRQTPISEDKGPYSETRGRQRGGLQGFRACESSHQLAIATFRQGTIFDKG